MHSSLHCLLALYYLVPQFVFFEIALSCKNYYSEHTKNTRTRESVFCQTPWQFVRDLRGHKHRAKRFLSSALTTATRTTKSKTQTYNHKSNAYRKTKTTNKNTLTLQRSRRNHSRTNGIANPERKIYAVPNCTCQVSQHS